MLEIHPDNALDYLHTRGVLEFGDSARVESLAWGVSNVVLRITPENVQAFVIKQSRTQLRTKDPWFSRLDRIWREAQVLRVLESVLPPGVVPRVLFEDRENFLFAMEAAPASHVVWKQLLLEGHTDVLIARQLGRHLAAIHRQTAHRPELLSQFRDIEVFVQLRVDPFYRRVAAASRDAAPHIEALIAEMFSLPVCLVLADYSPKNVLIAGERIVLVDFETAHTGDPAFDLGFFFSHLLLKAVRNSAQFAEYAALTSEFWSTYLRDMAELAQDAPFAPVEIVRRSMGHTAACMWARIDGTSQVDYLEEGQKQVVREFCKSLFREVPAGWNALLARLEKRLQAK